MNYYLGVDIGTTSAKTVAFSEKGEVLSKHSSAYEMLHPQVGWIEQSPDEILHAVIEGINKVVATLAPAHPVLVSFSAAMHSVMAVDEKGTPITNSIIWADNRAVDIADELKSSPKGYQFYEATGVPVHAMSPLCKLLWFKENEPDVFQKAHKFIGIKEYIFFKLFGEYAVDTAVASATALLNLRTLQWDETILQFAGLTSSKLSEVVDIKKIFRYRTDQPHLAKTRLHIPDKTPFVIGGSDGALANLGTGTSNKHSLVVTIGTSGAARIITQKPETDAAMRTFCYHAKDKSYIIGGASNNGAVVLQWLKDTLLQTDETYQQLFKMAKAAPPGSDGLLFLPYILGERAPLWNAYAKGNFFGLTINHTKSHLIRSVIEGIIFGIYSIGKIILEKSPSTEIYATGGFAHSPLVLQILADVFNRKVLVSGSVESSALGAVMVGMEALQIAPMTENKILSVHEPNLPQHEVYINLFAKFERIYELLKDEFAADHSLSKDLTASTITI